MAIQGVLKQLNRSIEALKDSFSKTSSKNSKVLKKKPKRRPIEEKVTRVKISLVDVVKITITIMAIYYLASVVGEIKSVLVILFISIIIASALIPGVDFLQKKKFPRLMAAIIVYILVLAVITLFFSSLVPVIAEQIFSLALNISNLFQKMIQMDFTELPLIGGIVPDFSNFLAQLSGDKIITQIESGLKTLATGLYAIGNSSYLAMKVIFGSIFNALIVFVMSFYMVLENKSIEQSLLNLTPTKYAHKFLRLSHSIQSKMGAWLRGQLLISFVLGVMIWVPLKLAGVPYAATLAIFTGLCAFVPYLGVLLPLIPIVLIAFTISFWTGVFVTLIYGIIQFVEANIILPIIMSKAVNLKPITVLVFLMVGGALYGIMGMVLAIPLTAIVTVFIDDYQEYKK